MERYMLFMGRPYYPKGGINDFIGDYTTLEAALEAWDYLKKPYGSKDDYLEEEKDRSWAHIYDIQTKTKVWEYG